MEYTRTEGIKRGIISSVSVCEVLCGQFQQEEAGEDAAASTSDEEMSDAGGEASSDSTSEAASSDTEESSSDGSDLDEAEIRVHLEVLLPLVFITLVKYL